jgi:hypothetical protein
MIPRLLFVFALVLPALSCLPGPTVRVPGPAATQKDTGSDAWPSSEEVLEYLDGKKLPLEVKDGNPDFGHSVTMQRVNIVALEVSHGGAHAGGEPWSTSITFIYDAPGDGKYAVDGRVQHRKVADKRAFFGFDVTRVAKQ